MGTIQHHALLVVVNGDSERARMAVEGVKDFARSKNEIRTTSFADLIVVVPGVVNLYTTVIMAPDGSKEYWDTSDRGDEIRAYFTKIMSTYGEVIEVSWGEYGTSMNGERVT
jgi:hypothetical protein